MTSQGKLMILSVDSVPASGYIKILFKIPNRCRLGAHLYFKKEAL